jgi:predicted double-glycine peptidase
MGSRVNKFFSLLLPKRGSRRQLETAARISKTKDFQKQKTAFACGASCLRRELPEPGARNFACGANYPHQALKGGYFVFVWRVGT